ncbi:CHASE3 domain-containing protein [Streptomyces sp. NPDC058674]|uniref:sensor histidine kinase n=1 Tax=Streptomyces sp. NPDC058674 TaxID=3346592 RepID=UPI003650A056
MEHLLVSAPEHADPAAAPPGPAAPPTRATRAAVRLRGLSVQAWFMTALALLAAMVLTTAGVGAALLANTTAAGDRLVDGIAPAQRDALRLEAALLDQETGIRGYLLTGQPALLEPYERGRANEFGALKRLDMLLDGEDDAQADVRAVKDAARGWRDAFATPAIASVRDGGPAPSVQEGKDRFDEVRRRIDAQQERLGRIQADARATFGQARSERDHIFLAVAVAFLLTAGCLAIVLHVGVVRPLGAVRAASRRVAGGAFDEEIPERGPSDLRSLSRAVEAMRRRTVEELAASRRNAAELERSAADLDAQAVELRRSNAELEQFAYVASHDLQEPLRKVASFCQLLEKRYGDSLDERGAQYIGFAVDGAKRMQVLINDLLTFSRVGRVQDARETVALDGTVDRALRNLAAAVEESEAEVVRPDGLPEVEGDPTLLTMLWQNLVANAVKFRAPGRAPRVEIGLVTDTGADPGFHTFSVTDNGIGIAPEFAEKVFVIFQRLHGREAYGGTGIGLSLCKKIVEHSGGRIWIDTDHTEGARLLFTLPVTAADRSRSPVDGSRSEAEASRPDAGSGAAPASVSAPAVVPARTPSSPQSAEPAAAEGNTP